MIYINSYPRSGNNYAQSACRMHLAEDFDIRHDPDILNTGIEQIVILRSPFEAVASNVERFALGDPEITGYETGIPVEQNAEWYINKYIAQNLDVYSYFIDKIENVDNSTMVVDFNSMTQDPEVFIRDAADFFGCAIIHEDKLAGIKENLHTLMSTEYQYFYPKHSTGNYRQIANKLIHDHPKADRLYTRYTNILVNQNIV